MAWTVPMMGFGAAGSHIGSPAGVDASPSSLQRRSLALGGEALRFGPGKIVADKPLTPHMYLSVYGTGIPMRGEETAGVHGTHGDGSPQPREAKLAVMYTAEGRGPETGAALKDRDSAAAAF